MTKTDVLLQSNKACDAIEDSHMHPDIKRGIQNHIHETTRVLDSVWDIIFSLESSIRSTYAKYKKEQVDNPDGLGLITYRLILGIECLRIKSLYRSFRVPDYYYEMYNKIFDEVNAKIDEAATTEASKPEA